jgi:hypothetical protein
VNALLASRRDAPVSCASCGRVVARRARQQRYCSARCQEKARARVRKAVFGRDTRAPGDPPKKHKQFKALQRAKTLSSYDIFGPEEVLAIEVFGRTWQRAISTDGVPIEISKLRPPGVNPKRRQPNHESQAPPKGASATICAVDPHNLGVASVEAIVVRCAISVRRSAKLPAGGQSQQWKDFPTVSRGCR